jgi:hypothetical protein
VSKPGKTRRPTLVRLYVAVPGRYPYEPKRLVVDDLYITCRF